MYATSLISSGDTATCLYNAPHEDEALPRVLPGKLLSLDAQCRKDRGTSACFVRFVALMPLLPIFVNIRQINGIILIFCTRTYHFLERRSSLRSAVLFRRWIRILRGVSSGSRRLTLRGRSGTTKKNKKKNLYIAR